MATYSKPMILNGSRMMMKMVGYAFAVIFKKMTCTAHNAILSPLGDARVLNVNQKILNMERIAKTIHDKIYDNQIKQFCIAMTDWMLKIEDQKLQVELKSLCKNPDKIEFTRSLFKEVKPLKDKFIFKLIKHETKI